MSNVLLLEKCSGIARVIRGYFAKLGLTTDVCPSDVEAVMALNLDQEYQIIIYGLEREDPDGPNFFEYLDAWPSAPPVLLYGWKNCEQIPMIHGQLVPYVDKNDLYLLGDYVLAAISK